MGAALSWDGEITRDGGGFTLLAPGTYPYVVTGFERSYHNGSANISACPMAIMTIEIDGGEQGTTTEQHRLFLNTKCEGLISEFFVSLGMKKRGETVKMDFDGAVGKRGMLKLANRVWVGNDGEERQSNEIKRFLPPAAQPAETARRF